MNTEPMTPGPGRDATLPFSREARERMRDQQRLEAERLSRVLAEQRRLSVEQQRADDVIAAARDAVAKRQHRLDQAIAALVDTSGPGRAGILLDRPEAEMLRLHRNHHQQQAGDDGPPPKPGRMPA
jgi:hypothetical protein